MTKTKEARKSLKSLKTCHGGPKCSCKHKKKPTTGHHLWLD